MLWGRFLLVAMIAVFAVAAVENGLDRVSSKTTGVERLVLAPFRARANRAAANTALDRNDMAAALTTSRYAVETDPVDPDATALLGSALMQVGRFGDAERTFRLAAKFGWRNARTQAFWYDAALQVGDYGVAAERLDALLRVHPQLVAQVDLLKPLESDAAGRNALADRLRLRPPWLDNYLKVADDTPSDVIDRRLAVLLEVRSARFELGCDTTAPFVHTLLDQGRRRDAETLWNGNCLNQKITGLLADPDFAQVLDTQIKNPFSWRVISSGDISFSQASGPNGARSLQITNTAPGTRLVLVQAVAFPEGVYRFHVSQPDRAPHTQGQLYISWACNGPPPFPDTSRGNLLVQDQVIEVGSCIRQKIGLWAGGGGASEHLRSIELEKVG